jgi:hypothetical protein
MIRQLLWALFPVVMGLYGTAVAQTLAPAKPKPLGAVAVLPTEPLSMYFPRAGGQYHAAYERLIAEAIEQDGRLIPVNRTELARVLTERKLELLGFEERSTKPIIAADVFVISHTITTSGVTSLRVQAIHGATGCLLGELTLPIDPAAPEKFDPPLKEAVARWWPGVLDRLAQVRTRPIWLVSEVWLKSEKATQDEALRLKQSGEEIIKLSNFYVEWAELYRQADSARRAILSSLAANDQVFVLDNTQFTEAQQEVLMRLMGLSAATLCRFTSGADFQLEAEMASPRSLALTLRSGRTLTVLETYQAAGQDAQKTLADAQAWIRRMALKYGKPSADLKRLTDAEYDEWAAKQARVEYQYGQLLEVFWLAQHWEEGYRHGKGTALPNDAEITRSLQERFTQHYRRAALLDPTWEDAAFGAASSYDACWGFGRRDLEATTRLHIYVRGGEQTWRFLHQFPQAERIRFDRAAMICYANYSTCYRAATKLVPGLDENDFRRIRRLCFDRAMEVCHLYTGRFWLKNSEQAPTPTFDFHIPILFFYYYGLEDLTVEEAEVLIKDWSRRYDQHTEIAPHSDFIRLLWLYQQGKKEEFVRLLGSLLDRWPDSKHVQWKYTEVAVNSAIITLFSGYNLAWFRNPANHRSGWKPPVEDAPRDSVKQPLPAKSNQ